MDDVLARGLDRLWVQDNRAPQYDSKARSRLLVRGVGCHVFDGDGRRLIDASSSGLVKAIGHGWPEIAQAVSQQLTTLSYTMSAHGYVTEPALRLAAKVAELAPGSLSRTFFCGGGSEAIEVALQLARHYQVLRGFPLKTKVISRRPEYHGSTYAARSISSHIDRNNAIFEPLLSGVLQVDAPHCARCPWGFKDRTTADCCMLSVVSTRNTIAAEGANNIASMIATPFRVGGSLPPIGYWEDIREICTANNIVLIDDEVSLSFGRVGRWFAIEHFGIVPDMIVMGKGLTSGELPAGAVIVSKEITDTFDTATGPDSVFQHSLTFGSHPVVMAAALQNIQIMERENLVASSAELGEYLFNRVQSFLRRRHPIVGDVIGGLGLLVTIALVKNRRTRGRYPGGQDGPFLTRLNELFYENGLAIKAGHTIVLAPPLTATREILDEIIDALDRSMDAIETEFPPES